MGVRDELNMQQDALLSQCRLNGNIVDLKKKSPLCSSARLFLIVLNDH